MRYAPKRDARLAPRRNSRRPRCRPSNGRERQWNTVGNYIRRHAHISELRSVAGNGGGTTTTCAPAGTSAPVAAAVRSCTLASTSVGSLASVCTTAMLDGIEDDAAESSRTTSTSSSEKTKQQRFADAIHDKLSPKVYCGQITKSLVHSLEDVNSSMEYARPFCHSSYTGKQDKPRPWGSLQEIRNLGSSVSDNCIVSLRQSFSLALGPFARLSLSAPSALR